LKVLTDITNNLNVKIFTHLEQLELVGLLLKVRRQALDVLFELVHLAIEPLTFTLEALRSALEIIILPGNQFLRFLGNLELAHQIDASPTASLKRQRARQDSAPLNDVRSHLNKEYITFVSARSGWFDASSKIQ
jgi:hypothetical protein